MAGEATQAIDKAELWGGGRSPFSVSYGKMMMWFFLISDALTFGGFLTALAFQRQLLINQSISSICNMHFIAKVPMISLFLL